MFKTIKKVRLSTNIQINMACQDCKKTSTTNFTTREIVQLVIGLYIIGSTIYSSIKLFEWLFSQI